jgi:hypothetical protein
MLGSVSRRRLVHNHMTCWTDAGRSVPFQSSKKPRFLERRTKCGGFRVATTTCGGQDAPRGVRRGDSNGSPQQSERVVPGPCESAPAGSDPGDRRPWKALDSEQTGRVARPVEFQVWQGPGVRTGSPVRRVRPSCVERSRFRSGPSVRRVGRDLGRSGRFGEQRVPRAVRCTATNPVRILRHDADRRTSKADAARSTDATGTVTAMNRGLSPFPVDRPPIGRDTRFHSPPPTPSPPLHPPRGRH